MRRDYSNYTNSGRLMAVPVRSHWSALARLCDVLTGIGVVLVLGVIWKALGVLGAWQ